MPPPIYEAVRHATTDPEASGLINRVIRHMEARACAVRPDVSGNGGSPEMVSVLR